MKGAKEKIRTYPKARNKYPRSMRTIGLHEERACNNFQTEISRAINEEEVMLKGKLKNKLISQIVGNQLYSDSATDLQLALLI